MPAAIGAADAGAAHTLRTWAHKRHKAAAAAFNMGSWRALSAADSKFFINKAEAEIAELQMWDVKFEFMRKCVCVCVCVIESEERG